MKTSTLDSSTLDRSTASLGAATTGAGGTGSRDSGAPQSLIESCGAETRSRGGHRTRDGIRAALAAVGRRGASSRPGGEIGTVSRLGDETGAATAEYAIATLAAVGFAGLLVVILRSEQVRGLLAGIIETALTVAG